uniref:RING-type domain-containing protein n=1 Tax=Chromera velia CCMP2878 TaxID=1169474 RepID=A0A0G4HFA7_9ALVE|eukprot:Cvel_26933.t1-p1 / transcript=Cvel_26933.t1 / gene=Cvel_26933 / organism=Chromera_velia_CCMP2878 / gene_product=RING finger protein 10, putative / transcript_product=RING finger protein 10, putative / location=Cvel_scaffold3279:4106-14542(-) / protein_length=1608 / sequence_SO=supercontig / SO=protein_coding / is_pseudo=false
MTGDKLEVVVSPAEFPPQTFAHPAETAEHRDGSAREEEQKFSTPQREGGGWGRKAQQQPSSEGHGSHRRKPKWREKQGRGGERGGYGGGDGDRAGGGGRNRDAPPPSHPEDHEGHPDFQDLGPPSDTDPDVLLAVQRSLQNAGKDDDFLAEVRVSSPETGGGGGGYGYGDGYRKRGQANGSGASRGSRSSKGGSGKGKGGFKVTSDSSLRTGSDFGGTTSAGGDEETRAGYGHPDGPGGSHGGVGVRGSKGKKGQGVKLDAACFFNFAQYEQKPQTSYTGGARKKKTTALMPYSKERFVQANIRSFVEVGTDVQSVLWDPQHVLDWNCIVRVELVLCLSEREREREVKCPICLDHQMVAPRMTKCGHYFCWPCVIRYLQSTTEKRYWRKCPICNESVTKKDLRPVLFHTVPSFSPNDVVDFVLVQRAQGCTAVTLPQYNTRSSSSSSSYAASREEGETHRGTTARSASGGASISPPRPPPSPPPAAALMEPGLPDEQTVGLQFARVAYLSRGGALSQIERDRLSLLEARQEEQEGGNDKGSIAAMDEALALLLQQEESVREKETAALGSGGAGGAGGRGGLVLHFGSSPAPVVSVLPEVSEEDKRACLGRIGEKAGEEGEENPDGSFAGLPSSSPYRVTYDADAVSSLIENFSVEKGTRGPFYGDVRRQVEAKKRESSSSSSSPSIGFSVETSKERERRGVKKETSLPAVQEEHEHEGETDTHDLLGKDGELSAAPATDGASLHPETEEEGEGEFEMEMEFQPGSGGVEEQRGEEEDEDGDAWWSDPEERVAAEKALHRKGHRGMGSVKPKEGRSVSGGGRGHHQMERTDSGGVEGETGRPFAEEILPSDGVPSQPSSSSSSSASGSGSSRLTPTVVLGGGSGGGSEAGVGYLFYQSADGQYAFLHPFITRCLLFEFGGEWAALPPLLKRMRVQKCSEVVMTEGIRRRSDPEERVAAEKALHRKGHRGMGSVKPKEGRSVSGGGRGHHQMERTDSGGVEGETGRPFAEEILPSDGVPSQPSSSSSSSASGSGSSRLTPTVVLGGGSGGGSEAGVGYLFYQSADGQYAFLHPFITRCLLFEFGGEWAALPPLLKRMRVQKCSEVVMTEGIRRRYKFLSHLPDAAIVRFLEVDVERLLSPATRAHFAEEFERKAKARKEEEKRKKREERLLQVMKDQAEARQVYEHAGVSLSEIAAICATKREKPPEGEDESAFPLLQRTSPGTGPRRDPLWADGSGSPPSGAFSPTPHVGTPSPLQQPQAEGLAGPHEQGASASSSAVDPANDAAAGSSFASRLKKKMAEEAEAQRKKEEAEKFYPSLSAAATVGKVLGAPRERDPPSERVGKGKGKKKKEKEGQMHAEREKAGRGILLGESRLSPQPQSLRKDSETVSSRTSPGASHPLSMSTPLVGHQPPPSGSPNPLGGPERERERETPLRERGQMLTTPSKWGTSLPVTPTLSGQGLGSGGGGQPAPFPSSSSPAAAVGGEEGEGGRTRVESFEGDGAASLPPPSAAATTAWGARGRAAVKSAVGPTPGLAAALDSASASARAGVASSQDHSAWNGQAGVAAAAMEGLDGADRGCDDAEVAGGGKKKKGKAKGVSIFSNVGGRRY